MSSRIITVPNLLTVARILTIPAFLILLTSGRPGLALAVFVAGGVTDARVPADQIPFYLVALFILPISVRLVITWLYNASGRSVPIVGLYHAGLGVATGSAFIPVLAPDVDPIWVYAGFAVLAAFVLIATRGRLGFAPAENGAVASEHAAATA